jgi:hypothetical protein
VQHAHELHPPLAAPFRAVRIDRARFRQDVDAPSSTCGAQLQNASVPSIWAVTSYSRIAQLRPRSLLGGRDVVAGDQRSPGPGRQRAHPRLRASGHQSGPRQLASSALVAKANRQALLSVTPTVPHRRLRSGRSERSRAGSDLRRYAEPMGDAMARTWALAGPPIGNFRSSRRRSSARDVVSERGSMCGSDCAASGGSRRRCGEDVETSPAAPSQGQMRPPWPHHTKETQHDDPADGTCRHRRR